MGRGINIVVRVWEQQQQQQADETSVSSEASLSSTSRRNIEHRATGHWVTATPEWPLVRRPLELLKSYIDTSCTKSTNYDILSKYYILYTL